MTRYAAIIDNPQAFRTSSTTPLPVCLWVNPIKSNLPALTKHLANYSLGLDPMAWMRGAVRVVNWPSPGQTLAFTAGWYYVQEEIAMAAVQALDPQPGERILDLCAAPGGKTAQIAVRLHNTGMVVANELHANRLPSLSTTVMRLGLTNVVTTQGDGRTPLFPSHYFDRVLVDVPCSGEGTLRRRRSPRPWRPEHGRRMAAAQKKLLSRALDFVKPGGVVVYSTCTFAPEENEAVLDAVISDRAHLEAIDIPGLRGQAGLTQWQGQSYRSDLSLAQRYFPHFNDTGGFFIARLRRTETQQNSPLEMPETPLMPPVSLSENTPMTALNQQFGIAADALKNHQCWSTGKRRFWLAHSVCTPPPGPMPQTIGIPIASQTNLGLKPSTAFLQRFGMFIQQNSIQLPDHEAVSKFLHGQSQSLSVSVDAGYVHVRFGPFHLGCGRYVAGKLQSQLPKTLRWVGDS
ncbi:MAG: NOL1/NOP2/sun family putative RNA methylase [Cyanobacteria bacterium P01_F01_bin.86]